MSAVCATVTADLEATGQFEWMTMSMDEDEHSIEMHLPYVAKIMEE
jgi:predicted class III extradiol MEMO1 family dioxygenase